MILPQGLLEFLHNNQFASGGLLVAGTGFAVNACKNGPRNFYRWCKGKVTTDAEVTSDQELFKMMEYWFYMNQQLFWNRITTFDVKYVRKILQFSPGLGAENIFRYKGKWFILSRSEKEEKASMRSLQMFHITCFSRDTSYLRSLLDEVIELSRDENEDKIQIFMHDSGSYWDELTKQPFRKPGSVCLPDGLFESLRSDIQKYKDSKERYEDLGIPHRRGFLFCGPPGNGKTSTIKALASEFKSSIYIMKLKGKSGKELFEGMATIPAGSFLVLEDIDALFASRVLPKEPEEDTGIDMLDRKKESLGVSFSEFINALDGIHSPEDYILFMTTNHPELLDPALIRPGRVDKIVNFENSNPFQAEAMIKKFYPEASKETVEDFSTLAGSGNTSLAKIQEILLCSSSPENAVESLLENGKETNDQTATERQQIN